MTADTVSMPPGPLVPPPLAEPPRWTAAEFLSSYRYWSLILAYVFASLAVTVFSTFSIPWLRSNTNSLRDAGDIISAMSAVHSVGSILGCGLGIAIGAAGRGTRAALVILIILSLTAAAPLLSSSQQFYGVLFAAWGLFSQLLTTTMLLATATMLVRARATAPDFAVTFGLLILIPATASRSILPLLFAAGLTDNFLLIVVLFLALALFILLPMRRLCFDVKPHRFHPTHALRWRSPGTVTFLALLGPFIVGVLLAIAASGAMRGLATISVVVVLASIVVWLLLTAAYICIWCYRIHAELASVESSHSLLTPLAAVLIALFVPFGLPMILIMLWAVIDERARRLTKAPVSRWAIFWSVFFPAIGMGMIQSAVNRTTRPA